MRSPSENSTYFLFTSQNEAEELKQSIWEAERILRASLKKFDFELPRFDIVPAGGFEQHAYIWTDSDEAVDMIRQALWETSVVAIQTKNTQRAKDWLDTEVEMRDLFDQELLNLTGPATLKFKDE